MAAVYRPSQMVLCKHPIQIIKCALKMCLCTYVYIRLCIYIYPQIYKCKMFLVHLVQHGNILFKILNIDKLINIYYINIWLFLKGQLTGPQKYIYIHIYTYLHMLYMHVYTRVCNTSTPCSLWQLGSYEPTPSLPTQAFKSQYWDSHCVSQIWCYEQTRN